MSGDGQNGAVLEQVFKLTEYVVSVETRIKQLEANVARMRGEVEELKRQTKRINNITEKGSK